MCWSTCAGRRFAGWMGCLVAAAMLLSGVSAVAETAVTGTLVINGGAAATASRSVTLALRATSLAGDLDTMAFSADGATWSAAETYATSKPFVLSPGNGDKTVWVKFADKLANTSPAISATIALAVPPLTLPDLQQLQTVSRQLLYQGGTTEVDLLGYVTDPAYKRVLLQTALGDIQLRLYQAQTPLTVASFLRCVQNGTYDGTVFHRLVKGSVLQGGGYLPEGSSGVKAVAGSDAIPGEFGVANTRGTVAMAKLPGDASRSGSEWFFNLADNAACLDYQDGGFTVFGEALAPGMTVVDAIAALPVASLGDAFSAVPVRRLRDPIQVSDLLCIDAATLQPDELAFLVTGSPAGITASVENGTLVCTAAANAALGDGTVALRVTAFDGRALPLAVPVTVLGRAALAASSAVQASADAAALSTGSALAEDPVATPLPCARFADQTVTLFYTGSATLDLLEYVTDPAYKRALFRTTKGDVALRLFAARAPQTVANFLRYVDTGKYDNTLIHRAVSGFVVQGGGYAYDKALRLAEVVSFGPITNEFGASNLRGTMAMAKTPGNPNSATCEWFLNLADNSASLDTQNGGFTVFGDTSAMTAVDAIAALQIINAGDPLTALPVLAFDGSTLVLKNLVFLLSATRQPDQLAFALSGSVAGVTAAIVNGQLVLRATGAVQSATGSFTLHVTAPDGRAADVPVPVLVSANHPPVIGNGAATQTVQCTEDTPAKITLSAKDADRGDVLTWTVVEQPRYGAATLLPPATTSASSRTIVYTPQPNAWGPDRFVVRVTDDKGGRTSLIVKLVGKPVNDAPALTGLPASVTVQAGEAKTMSFALADVDSPLRTMAITCTASNKTLFPTAQTMTVSGVGASRSLRLAPAFTSVASTAVTITITVSDGAAKVVYKLPVTVTAGRVPARLSLEPTVSQMAPGTSKRFSLVAIHTNGDVVTLTSGAFKLTATANLGAAQVSGDIIGIPTYEPPGAVVQVTTSYAGKTATAAIAVVSQVPTEKYLVINISSGPDATRYTHTTLSAPPTGGWTDTYRTSKLVLRYVPAGSALIGSPTRETGRNADEAQFQATLTKAFYIGVFEVTQKQWLNVMGGTTPAAFATGGDTRPVESVSWTTVRGGTWPGGTAAAASFIGRLAQKAGLAIDLPTAAQWEYACRAGITTALYSGKSIGTKPLDPNLALLANHAALATLGTLPVGGFRPNFWGLYDTLGNVGEWCLDGYGPYPASAVSDYAGAAAGTSTNRVARGGAWADPARNCRCASRAALAPDATGASSVTGFRVSSSTDGF